MADRERVRWHLEQAKKNAHEAIEGRARLGKDWAADPVTKAGLTKLVETTAEYMGNVPLEIREKFPGVPWTLMAGMRNLTSHEYHRLDVEIVENTVQVDLPKLIGQIDQMLAGI
ncbi:MAG: HepT-like ribonuclease domain-containing protein [Chloroflexota bacterium]